MVWCHGVPSGRAPVTITSNPSLRGVQWGRYASNAATVSATARLVNMGLAEVFTAFLPSVVTLFW
jgi:hypothetical protein